MLQVEGSYNTAIIYTDQVEESAIEQIKTLCDQKFTQGCCIRVMPDAHTGKGCVIGFTADLGERVIPNIVGVDIGCGMLTVELGREEVNFEKLDHMIREKVPSGKHVHEGRIMHFPKLTEMECYRELKDSKRIVRSIGTLGGGNHFIEIDQDEEECFYLVIHTGSRNLGKQVAEYYQKLAYDLLRGKDEIFAKQKQIIEEYKAAGRKSEIQAAIVELKKSFEAKDINIPKELCYLTGEYREKYLHDMQICQEFASINRMAIANIILSNMYGKGIEDYEFFETVHNYIDYKRNIVRKGAVSAEKGEKLLIPINMRDGSLICIGKGNADWNYSAPHGAGRVYSRTSAKQNLSMEEFTKEMEGIYTTSISEATLDESPMAYKKIEDIVENITPTAEIVKRIKTVYNFKAAD